MSDKAHGGSSYAIANPWSYPVVVSKIPESGLHVSLDADEQLRTELAQIGGLRNIQAASATFDVFHGRSGAVEVTGRVTGRVGQECVVTLEPLDSDIDEEVEIVFAEPDTGAAAARQKADDDEEEPDPPELIENGVIDLGKLAADMFFLGIDPYPRKPEAVSKVEEVVDDPEDHPFAALKALKNPRS